MSDETCPASTVGGRPDVADPVRIAESERALTRATGAAWRCPTSRSGVVGDGDHLACESQSLLGVTGHDRGRRPGRHAMSHIASPGGTRARVLRGAGRVTRRLLTSSPRVSAYQAESSRSAAAAASQSSPIDLCIHGGLQGLLVGRFGVNQRVGLAEQQRGALLDVVGWGEIECGAVVAGRRWMGVDRGRLVGGFGECGARFGNELSDVLAELARGTRGLWW